MSKTYLTVDELSERIKYDPRYIRETLKDRVFVEGVHYIRPFGRKILFVWEAIEEQMSSDATSRVGGIPLCRGGTCHG